MATLTTTLTLKDYPSAIAAAERKALQMRGDIRMMKESLLQITILADLQVADESAQKLLTNDQQRKIRKQTLLDSNPDYQMVIRNLQQSEDSLAELQISIDLLRGEFSILKLEMRERIASMELSASSAAA